MNPIVNQAALAKIMGITPQWFTTLKNSFRASDEQLALLEGITGIKAVNWVSPARKNFLKKELKSFFRKEKARARLEQGQDNGTN